jgi:hypothetical protein
MKSNWYVSPTEPHTICEGGRPVALAHPEDAKRIVSAMNSCEYAATMMGGDSVPQPQ